MDFDVKHGAMVSMRRMVCCVIAAAGLFFYRPAAHAEVDQVGQLRVSPDGHYLTEADGSPFFWLADTAWDLFQRLDREEVDHYFKDRAGKGFTVIQAAIGGGGGHQGPNKYGDTPFIEGDPTRPNERYFAHVDWVIDRARHHGLRMAVFPYWAAAYQFQYGAPGGPLRSMPVTFDPRTAEIYARWLGQRYRDAGISWIFGGDSNPLWPRVIRVRTDASGNGTFVPEQSDMSARDWRPVHDAMAMGLSEGEGRQPFITYHPNCCTFPGMPKPLTSIFFGDRRWLTMNMIQSSHYESPPEDVHGDLIGFSFGWRGPMNYDPIAHEFASTPVRPVIDGEPRYEDLGRDNDARNVARKGYWTGYDARNAAYHSVFAGAAGHAYGNHAIWQFADPQNNKESNKVDPPITPGLTWREALQRPVSGQLRYLKALMLSRPYFTRVPDQSLIVGDAGDGTAHIGATRDKQGSYAMVYVPQGQPVTLDLTRISGPRAMAWWFDPRNGQAARIERTFATSSQATFTPPSSGAGQDWVLVIDDVSKRFGTPGDHAPQPEQHWYRCNTHTHTNGFPNSDANASPSEVARWYKEHGYQCVVITDHEHLTDVRPLNEAYGKDGMFLAISGQEVTQSFPDLAKPNGVRHLHVNGISTDRVVMPQPIPATVPTGLVPVDLYQRNFSRIEAAGGVPQVNHPNLQWSVHLDDLLPLPQPFLLEIWNAAMTSNNLGGLDEHGAVYASTENLWDELLSRGKRVWGVASDDAHQYQPAEFEDRETLTPGKGWIVVRAQALTVEAIIAALKAGHFYASTGITLTEYRADGQGISISIPEPVGHSLGKGSGLKSQTRYLTRFIGENGRVLAEVAGLSPRYEFKGDERYVRASIMDSDGRRAWTQPVFRSR